MANQVFEIFVRDRANRDIDREFLGQAATQAAAISAALTQATGTYGFVKPYVVSVKVIASATGANQLDF